jgi:hypothetical protein
MAFHLASTFVRFSIGCLGATLNASGKFTWSPKRQRHPPDKLTYKALVVSDLSSVQLPEGDDPSLQDALKGPNSDMWWDAIYQEYSSLLANGTWEEVQYERGMNILPCKWVLKAKRDAMGNLERFKARLVVCGNYQREGVDYDEVFAPTSRYSTLRIILAHVAVNDLEMRGLDVQTAFLNGDLTETVYMRPPKLFEPENPNTVYVIKKSLYGLKQAPRAWRKKLEECLIESTFKCVMEIQGSL